MLVAFKDSCGEYLELNIYCYTHMWHCNWCDTIADGSSSNFNSSRV